MFVTILQIGLQHPSINSVIFTDKL